MKAKYFGMGLIAVALLVVGWCIGQSPLTPKAQAQGGDKVKGSRYQVVGAGLITAVLFDTETGKTWALTPGNMMNGPGSFGGTEQEFAWAPITKFDDLENYRRWVKQQQETRMKLERERYKDRDKGRVDDKPPPPREEKKEEKR